MKIIHWPTNYNNKLSCKGFVHITYAPQGDVPISKFPMPVEIIADDQTAPPTHAFIVAVLPLKLDQVNDLLAIASHGICAAQFCAGMLRTETQYNPVNLAIYVYSADKKTANFFLPIPDNNIDNSKP